MHDNGNTASTLLGMSSGDAMTFLEADGHLVNVTWHNVP